MQCFNWATPRTGWKDRRGRRRGIQKRTASIGPPRERGGKARLRSGFPRSAGECFNWATPRTGWKGWDRQQGQFTWAGGFNWATPRTGWKVNRYWFKSFQDNWSFNWATPRTGWKDKPFRMLCGKTEIASIGPPRERGGKAFREARSVAANTSLGMLQLGHPANGVESR